MHLSNSYTISGKMLTQLISLCLCEHGEYGVALNDVPVIVVCVVDGWVLSVQVVSSAFDILDIVLCDCFLGGY